MTLKFAIIADDLTGALDAAAPFARRGFKTLVTVQCAAVADGLAQNPDVMAINTDSREMSADDAAARVRQVMAALPTDVRLIKKIDSRMKGNIAAELAALNPTKIAVLPAIPEFDRYVKNAHVTGFGIDQPISVRAALGPLGDDARIPDIATMANMQQAIAELDSAYLLVGARGLTEALATQMAGDPAPTLRDLGDHLSMVIGSMDPITLAQIEALKTSFPDIDIIHAPNGQAPAADLAVHTQKGLCLIHSVQGNQTVSPEAVSAALAACILSIDLPQNAGLLLSGGATAQAVLHAMDISVLEITGEILGGLPVSTAGDLTIITKSGGFGAPDALVQVANSYLS